MLITTAVSRVHIALLVGRKKIFISISLCKINEFTVNYRPTALIYDLLLWVFIVICATDIKKEKKRKKKERKKES